MTEEAKDLQKEVARLTAANQILSMQLLRDSQMFNMYAKHHEGKDPPDVDKAIRNRNQVNEILASINASRRVLGCQTEQLVGVKSLVELGAQHYWFPKEWEATFNAADLDGAREYMETAYPGDVAEVALAAELPSVFAVEVRSGPIHETTLMFFPTREAAESAYAQSVEVYRWEDEDAGDA